MTMNDLHLHHPQKKTLRVATLAEKKAIQDECQLPLVSLFLLQKVLLDKCLLLTNLVSTYGSYMEVDLDFSSNRKLKNFLRSPAAFLVAKLRDCEFRSSSLGQRTKKSPPSSRQKLFASASTMKRNKKPRPVAAFLAVAGFSRGKPPHLKIWKTLQEKR